jgi:nicotinate phosphoribosyltransferase
MAGMAVAPRSTALNTDHYELTMLDAARQSGVAGEPVVFEVFTRSLPPGRGHGVFCGLGRLVDAIGRFRFGPDELSWLAGRRIVSDETLAWLSAYRFTGTVRAYREGEVYGARSPVLTVEGSFGDTVLLETLTLSILNHDSAIGAAAERLVLAAGGRPIIEMGARRADPDAAVASARAAWIAGFDSTSNLEAGRRFGIPTAGTSSHAFVLAHPDEETAFAAQVKTMGPDTTLLVDTLDIEDGIRRAVAVAGPALGAIRIDSGDLIAEAVRARRLLDELGAPSTRIIVTGELDERALAALASAPVDGYGVGTSVVTGLGRPTAGFVYKLVEVAGRPVAKRSAGKATTGGRKWAWRLFDGEGRATGEEMATQPEPPDGPHRDLQVTVLSDGETADQPSIDEVRRHHLLSCSELPADGRLPVRIRDGS